MKRAHWIPLLMVLAGQILILATEQLDTHMQKQAQRDAANIQLQQLQARMQAIFHDVVRDTEFLAQELSTHPEYLDVLDSSDLIAGFNPHPAVFSTSFSRHLTIVYAHPPIGNESIIGLDYTRRIEFAAAVRQTIQGRSTVIEGPVKLQQTDRKGIVVRTPFYDSKNQFLGMVNSSMDMEALLELAGYRPQDLDLDLLIRAVRPDQPSLYIMGSGKRFNKAHPGVVVNLTDKLTWELRAVPALEQGKLDRRADVIRLTGTIVVLLATALVTRRLSVWREVARAGSGVSLYLALTMAMLLPMLLLIGVFVGVSYYKIQRAGVQLMQQQA